jgi:hypothetical protein
MGLFSVQPTCLCFDVAQARKDSPLLTALEWDWLQAFSPLCELKREFRTRC